MLLFGTVDLNELLLRGGLLLIVMQDAAWLSRSSSVFSSHIRLRVGAR